MTNNYNNNQSWTFIVLAYNEEGGINDVVEKSLNILRKISPRDRELVIVNDGSTDNSFEIINKLAITYSDIVVVHHEKNKGVGAAILSGFKIARFENICIVPADGQFDVNELLPYANIPNDTILSFYRKKKTGYSAFRLIVSNGNELFNRFFLGIKIKDINWVTVYKKKFIDNFPITLTSSLLQSELCAKLILNKFNIIEVESVYHIRKGGISKGVSSPILFGAIREIFKLYSIIRKYKKQLVLY